MEDPQHLQRNGSVLRLYQLPNHRGLDRPGGRARLPPVAQRAFVADERRREPPFRPFLHLVHPARIAWFADVFGHRRERVASAALHLLASLGGFEDKHMGDPFILFQYAMFLEDSAAPFCCGVLVATRGAPC